MTAATPNGILVPAPALYEQRQADCATIAEELRYSLQAEFSIWDGDAGELLLPGQQDVRLGDLIQEELVRAVVRQREVQFIADADGLMALAVPFVLRDDASYVATSVFVTSDADKSVDRIANVLRLDADATTAWLDRQRSWEPDILLRMAEAVAAKVQAESEAARMRGEVDMISHNLASTYEEISLLYTVTQNLRISRSDEELGQLAIDWLVDCVPANAFAIQYLPVAEDSVSTYKTRTNAVLIRSGDCPVDGDSFQRLVDHLELTASSGAHIANTRTTADDGWEFPDVEQLIIVPLTEGENVFGWLAAFNHAQGEDFGTVEANLMASVGTLLGIHSGNRELYRQQSELLASLVRALVSAIDAKDPYTSGHSDRVARYAVRLALELQIEPSLLNTIYMAGLLHDVGKIGIDDNVLRKAGRLTEAEFEHIKLHPELGHRILADIKQLADVLPSVLHHHERWDGNGYPHGLQGEDIPRLARIMSVADAYDAMTSDRPYRAGMPDEKVDEIFRDGSGAYWDPTVVEAYFKAKADIEDIRWHERDDEPELEKAQQEWGV